MKWQTCDHETIFEFPIEIEEHMPAYHPTTIRLHSNNCPHAVELWKLNTPYDRSIFHTGVIAHAILEEIGKNPDKDARQVADKIVEKYCSEGRAYDSIPEPPAPLADALEGAKLALDWHRKFPVPFGDGITHEHPFAFTDQWASVDYNDKTAKFRTLLDVVEIHEEYNSDTGETYTRAIIRDYKTSWVATYDELDSFQRRCQAVVVWLFYRPDFITLEIANLRLRCNFSKEIDCHEQQNMLQEWQDNISTAIRTLDKQLNPNPGAGCVQCQYSPYCEYFDSMYKSDDVYRKYIAAKEIVAKLEPQIRKIHKAKPPKRMGLGLVGYAQKKRKKILPTAQQTILQKWTEQDGTLHELFTSMDLSIRVVEKLARKITSSKEEREQLIQQITREEPYSSFGIHKDK